MSTNLFEKLCGRHTEKIYQLDKTLVKLRVLSQGDVDEVLRAVGADDFLAKGETVKRPTLARAIVEVDGRPVDTYPEISDILKTRKENFPNEGLEIARKVAVEDFLGKLSPSVIEALYKAYGELQKEDSDNTEKLKKNWKVDSPEPSGK